MRGMTECLKFHAYKGDWEAAKNFIDGDPNLKKEVTSINPRVILDCARKGGHWKIFNQMVQLITDVQTLTIPFDDGKTILHRIAHNRGSMESAKALVEKCPCLTQTEDSRGFTPLYTAIRNNSKDSDLAWYLALETTDGAPGCPFSGPHAPDPLYSLSAAGLYGAYVIYSLNLLIYNSEPPLSCGG